MASLRARVVILAVAATATFGVVRSAEAAVRIPVPRGWTEAVPPAARARAEGWAVGESLQTVVSPTSRDDFAETLAVIARHGALLPADLEDDARAEQRLAEAAAQMFDITTPADQTLRIDGDPVLLRGRWTTADSVIHMVLVPTGATHSAVVLEVERGTDVLYADVFDDAVAGLTGASAPVVPFPSRRWWVAAVVGWLLAAGVGGVAIARATPSPGPTTMGRRVAAVAVGLAALVAIVTYVATSGRETQLAMIGLSRAWFAVQIGVGGLLVAAVAFVVGRVLERRGAPIASAPSAGAYASRRPPGAPDPAARMVTPVAGLPVRPVTPLPGTTMPITERPVVTSSPPPPPPPPTPPAAAPPAPPAFPSPGRSAAVADLLLDEPAARLEPVHEGAPEQAASLATAQISLDGRPRGGRFGAK